MKFTCTGTSGESVIFHSIGIFSFGEYCRECFFKIISCAYGTKIPFNAIVDGNFDGMIFTASRLWIDKKFLSHKTEGVEVYRSVNLEDIVIFCEK